MILFRSKHTFATLTALTVLAATLSSYSPVARASDENVSRAQQKRDGFVILLSGVYQPVPAGQGPQSNLGLKMVDLNDGSFSTVNFEAISGIPGNRDNTLGSFYVQIGGMHCAYDLPGGSLVAMFTVVDDIVNSFETFPDGSWTLDGTFELEILEGTGVYSNFAGGHIHMVDILKFRADGTFLEDCFCHIAPKP
jgi:hypothetical protein